MATNKTVFFLIGILLIVLGTSMLAPYALQVLFNEKSHSFISASFVTIFTGVLFILANLEKEFKLNLKQTFLFSSLAWVMVAIFGSLPFLLSDQNFSLSEAFFESMSGITTTGATIISDLDNSPKSILLWRAIMQWLGGIGIVVMAITILPLLKVGGMQLFKMEGPGSTEKILPRTIEVATIIISTYIVLTFICGFFYWTFGMTIFDSVSHAMTTIATGGFSTHNDSIGYFKSSNIEIVASIFIILGSIPFIAYIKYLNGDKKIFFKDTQIKTFIKIILFSIILMYLYLFIKNQSFFDTSIRSVAFNVISILTGTGYVTQNFSEWGQFPLIYFLILMFIGGCAGSTACGIKIFRVQILFQFISIQLKKIIYPRGIFKIKYENNNIDEKFLASIISFIFLYIVIFFVITALLSTSGLDLTTSISAAATSISNVGPGLGDIIGPNGNFSNLSDFSKWILSLAMILGRLELFAVLVLFIPSFWRKY